MRYRQQHLWLEDIPGPRGPREAEADQHAGRRQPSLSPNPHGDTGLPARRGTHFSWNCRNPGLTWGLAFSREVVAKGDAGR